MTYEEDPTKLTRHYRTRPKKSGEKTNYRPLEAHDYDYEEDIVNANHSSRSHSDPNAPQDPKLRRSWLNRQVEKYTIVNPNSNSNTSHTHPDSYRTALFDNPIYKVVDFQMESAKQSGKSYKDPLSKLERDEKNWLDKRQKELNKQAIRIMFGSSVALSMWFLWSTTNSLMEKAPAHPAAGVEIGSLIELKFSAGGRVLQEPVVLGLFTERAPAACENLHRLVTGRHDEAGVDLVGKSVFSCDAACGMFMGSMGANGRGGVTVIPAKQGERSAPARLRQLPREDPDLPPFKWAVVSCAPCFLKNGGFNSIFGIINNANPMRIGQQEFGAAHQIVSQGKGDAYTRLITGRTPNRLRDDFEPEMDGVYVFGTVLQGFNTLQFIMSNCHGKPPHFAPQAPKAIVYSHENISTPEMANDRYRHENAAKLKKQQRAAARLDAAIETSAVCIVSARVLDMSNRLKKQVLPKINHEGEFGGMPEEAEMQLAPA